MRRTLLRLWKEKGTHRGDAAEIKFWRVGRKPAGWAADAQTDAAAKTGSSGAAYSGAVQVAPGVWVYQITKKGLALQLTLQGTKYYKDDDLNKKS